MSADTENKTSFWRKPSITLRIGTAVVIIDGVWCVVVSILAATGQLLGHQSIECGDFLEFSLWVQNEAALLYKWTSFNLLACVLILFELWRRHGHYFIMAVAVSIALVIGMSWSLANLHDKQIEETITSKQRHLVRMLDDGRQMQTRSDCDIITNLHRWQAEFKCCGFVSHEDWNGSIPVSCLCDGEEDMSECMSHGNSFIYDKPCLPTVLSLVMKRSFSFWVVTITWIAITSIPLVLFLLFVFGYGLKLFDIYYESRWNDIDCSWPFWTDKTVPVVFIGKNNNNQTNEEEEEEEEEEEDWKHKGGSEDGDVVLDLGDGLNEEGEAVEPVNPVKMITLSLLSRLQEELDPPPVLHWVTNEPCMCIAPPPRQTKQFYTVLIEEGSPLLPSDAVLVDANKPMKICYWDKGHLAFDCRNIVWPKAEKQSSL